MDSELSLLEEQETLYSTIEGLWLDATPTSRNIFIHIAAWGMLLLSPFHLVSHEYGIDWIRYAIGSISTVFQMVVFYANYCWLIPRFFINHHRKSFWMINTMMILTLGLLLHLCMHIAHQHYQPPHLPHEPTQDMGIWFFFALHDVFNLGIAAGIAITIVLALRWQESERARSEAELKNLRLQIKPHFLLNTLNNIYALVAFDSEKAQRSIYELSGLLRHILYDNQKQWVPIDEEVRFLEHYVHLMSIRLPENVDVRFTSHLTRPEPPVAPMLFISLVENAFKHGISATLPSFVHINISADDHTIVCSISNSNFPKNATDHSGHGIGLHQVRQRLELIYPQRYEWLSGPNTNQTIYTSTITIRL